MRKSKYTGTDYAEAGRDFLASRNGLPENGRLGCHVLRLAQVERREGSVGVEASKAIPLHTT